MNADTRPTILVVDDHEATRKLLVASATTSGFRVVDECADAHQALASFKQHEPTAVLMDLSLPGEMDGLAASQVILSLKPHTLVVACSGFSDPDGMLQAFEAGAHRCLRKPIRMEEAHRLFENLFEEIQVVVG